MAAFSGYERPHVPKPVRCPLSAPNAYVEGIAVHLELVDEEVSLLRVGGYRQERPPAPAPMVGSPDPRGHKKRHSRDFIYGETIRKRPSLLAFHR
jgi:hypothetical protein